MERPANKGWLWWNMANIITCIRGTGPLWFFVLPLIYPVDVYILMWIYVGLTLTDPVDGLLARWSGNSKGIGKFLDPVADKILHISFFIRLLISGKIDIPTTIIFIAAIYFEVRISKLVLDAINFTIENEWRKNVNLGWWEKHKLAYLKIKEKIRTDYNVNEPGKYKMIAYSLGGYFFLWNFVFPHKINYWTYLICFATGLYFSFNSLRKYRFDFEKWKQRFLSE